MPVVSQRVVVVLFEAFGRDEMLPKIWLFYQSWTSGVTVDEGLALGN